MMKIVHFSSILTCMCLSCCAQTWDDSVDLMTDKLENYHKGHRPIIDQSQALQVNISFEMVAIQDLDEVTGKFTAFGFFYMAWMDQKITWNPWHYGGMYTQLYSVKDIWYPLLVATSSYDKIDDIADDWVTVRVFYYGYAYFSPGVVLKSTCGIDVTYYPFDKQECVLSFSPWGYWPNEIKLNSISPYAARTYYSEGGEWKIVENATFVDALNNYYIKLVMARKPLFAVINIIMPILLMSVLNVLVFVLPPEAGERVSFMITVVLSTAVFMTLVADNLPKTSQPMSILAYFLLVNLSLSTMMCVATILNMRVYFKKESQPVPSWVRAMCRIVNCKTCSTGKRQGKNKITPIEINVISKTAKGNDPNALLREIGDVEEKEEPITWQDVAAAIDKIMIISFSVATLISTIVFIVILVSNKGAIGD